MKNQFVPIVCDSGYVKFPAKLFSFPYNICPRLLNVKFTHILEH